jgi:hypothetical protein
MFLPIGGRPDNIRDEHGRRQLTNVTQDVVQRGGQKERDNQRLVVDFEEALEVEGGLYPFTFEIDKVMFGIPGVLRVTIETLLRR